MTFKWYDCPPMPKNDSKYHPQSVTDAEHIHYERLLGQLELKFDDTFPISKTHHIIPETIVTVEYK